MFVDFSQFFINNPDYLNLFNFFFILNIYLYIYVSTHVEYLF